MTHLVYLKNPLSIKDREIHEIAVGSRPIDWLQEHYPNGCGGAIRFFVNDGEQDLDDLDYEVKKDDIITLMSCPTGFDPISIAIYIAVMIVMTAVQMIMASMMKKPEPPKFARSDNADNSQPSPVYDVRSSQNIARIGECIPVAYGEVLHTPDLAAQAYSTYYNSRDQKIDMLLCLGLGEFDVDQVLVADSDVQTIVAGTVQYHVIPPSVHQGMMGNLNVPFVFMENVLTAKEVAEQELINAGDTIGYYRLGKAGQVGRSLMIDVSFPRGVYQLTSQNVPLPSSVTWDINYQEADPDGNPIGAVFSQQTTFNSQGGFDPYRLTYTYDLGKDASWLVQMVRVTAKEPNGGEINGYNWTGLKLKIKDSTDPVYGNATLMAISLVATQISAGVQQLIKVRLKRKLPLLGSGTPELTASPADAFIDILTNQTYGAKRPLTEVDVSYLSKLKTYWGPDYKFNGIYTGRTTVWEALGDAVQAVGAAPLPTGGLMSVNQDGIKSIRQIMFTEQNIVRNSFRLSYSFDELGAPDGVEVEYRNKSTFVPGYAKFPANCVDPEKVVLFGCTDPVNALQYARLMWQRKMYSRRTISLDTEMEGLFPLPGARAAISHTLPRWGMSGFVVGVEDDRLNITLDRVLKWDEVTAPWYMMFRSEFGGTSEMVQVLRGATDNKAILSSDPWMNVEGDWSLTLRQEITHFTWGDATRIVKDFILSELTPRDKGKVGVAGIYYNPLVYENTMPFLLTPVPSNG